MSIGLILKRILFFILFGSIFAIADNTSNDTCAQAEVVALSYNGNGNLRSTDKNDYFSFTPTSDGTVTITVSGATRNIDAYLYNSNCGSTLASDTTNNNNPVITNVAVQAGVTYKLRLLYAPNNNNTNYTLNIAFTSSGMNSNFPSRKSINLTGNMKIIGNTVLCPKNNAGQCIESSNGTSNADVNLRYTKLTTDSSNNAIFNSSSATLLDTAITSPTAAKVKWAGLYWSGYLSRSAYTQTQANTLINSHTVKLSIAGANYIDISSHTVLGQIVNGNYLGTSYGCFADVTSVMQNIDPRGEYKVANIPSTEGMTRDQNDGLGNSGAWTLVIIYENTSAGEKTRNATVFDGFLRVYDIDGNSNNGAQTANDVNIDLSGFRTPKGGNIDSTLSVFANEGDAYISGDQFRFTNTDGDRNGQFVTLASPSGTNNYFDSSIIGVTTRNPNIINNNGIDIHTDQIGAADYNVIGTNQTKARITLTTAQDTYFPVMVAFATELARPSICYDYAAVLDNQMIPLGSDNLTFNPYIGGSELTAKVFIRALNSDFDLQNTQLTTNWSDVTTPVQTPSATFSYQQAFIQAPREYWYDPAISITGKTETISIGRNNSATGGLLEREESVYANMIYNVSNLAQKTIKLNIEVNGQYSLDPANPTVLTPFNVSTDNNSLPKCDGNVTYNPRWLNFNIERSNAGRDDYNLYTQVTGLPFDLKVVSYSSSNTIIDDKTQLTNPMAPSGNLALEAELFEIPQYTSLSEAGYQNFSYDRVCEDSSNSRPWKNNERKFFLFPNTKTSIPFPVLGEENKYAIRSAAVRIWLLLRPDKETIVHHSCLDTKGSCFTTLYNTNSDSNGYKADGKCGICATGAEEACYQCLKRYYGQPVCSRDNFAIRPDGIKLSVGDNGVELSNNYKNTPEEVHLASGYDYNVSFVAKNADSTDTLGYYMHGTPFVGDIVYKVFSLMQEMNKFFGVLFDTATGISCVDTNHTSMDYYAKILSHDNVGKYNLYYTDNDWTLVDHEDYAYKTRPGADCINLSTAQSVGGNMAGCATSSQSVNASGASDYSLLPIRFHPYKYSLNDTNMTKVPNDANRSWVYMNSINNTVEANASNMAVAFQGTIQAQSKKGKVTTNFTDGCAAEDLDLNLSYTSNDFNATLRKPITAKNIDTSPRNNHASEISMVGMQYRLQSDGTNGDVNNTSSVKFSKTLFTNSGKGVASIDLRYNIEKILDKVVNPLSVIFQKLGAFTAVSLDPKLRIKAFRDNNFKLQNGSMAFRPIGVRSYDTNVTFIYGRVYTNFEANPPTTTDANIITSISALAYCNPLTPASSKQVAINCDNYKRAFNIANSPVANWFTVNMHPGATITNYQDYGIIQSFHAQLGSSARVNPSSATFDTNGTTGNVMISHPMSGRTHVAEVTIVPDLWLKYHVLTEKEGNPFFNVVFQQANQNWSGVGVTGNVINKNTTTQNAKNRLSW